MNLPSNHPTPTRIIFFQTPDNRTKLQRVVETAQLHFERKEPLLFFVEDAKAQLFVDELLWKLPSTSFLPHIATDQETSDLIAITTVKKNLNQARLAFNLCGSPLFLESPFRIIYELEDLTTPSKKNLSSLRFDAYKRSGFLIEARPLAL